MSVRKKALLVIGDQKVNKIRSEHSLKAFIKYIQEIKGGRVEFAEINYARLLHGQMPQINAPCIQIILFFPYQYWNQYIEVPQSARIYGEDEFGQEFKLFLKKVKRKIESSYRGKKIEYVNSPQSCYLDRDKKLTKDLLHKSGVSTPRNFQASSFIDIQKLLNKNINLYIKPRFGAMGKGITYIDKERVVTNFIFYKDKILNRIGDYHWKITKIKDRDKEKFIDILLRNGFICEEAVTPPTFKNRRFDFRVYVLYGKVVYFYAKSSKVKLHVTNWSQGGKIDKKRVILNAFPRKKIKLLKRLSKKAAQVLGLNFAGIDIIFSSDLKKAYVLESNAFPGYERGFDLMKCLMNRLIK